MQNFSNPAVFTPPSDNNTSNYSQEAKNGISIIIPAYNERDRIKKSLDNYIPVIESFNLPYEIIVVIDGNDGTEDVIKNYKNLKYFKSYIRLGKGGAVKKGLSMAQFRWVGFVDADGSLAPDDFKKLLLQIQGNSCVISSRYINGSKWINKEPFFKRFASRGFNLFVNLVLNLKVKDTQCGAKFFKFDIIKKIIPQIEVTNWTFDVAILYHIKRMGYNIKEIPVKWSHDLGTKFNYTVSIIPMFLTVIAIKLMNSRIKDYVPELLFKIVSKFKVY